MEKLVEVNLSQIKIYKSVVYNIENSTLIL